MSTATLNFPGLGTVSAEIEGELTPTGNVTLGDNVSDTITMSGSVAGNVSFVKEASHVIAVVASTTADANGGNLTIRAGAKNGSGTDGVLTLGDSNTSEVVIGASGAKIGFFGVTAATRPAALTQTYATADATLSNPTAAALTDNSTGTPGATIAAITEAANAGSADTAPTKNAIASLAAQVNALRTDLLDLAQFVNSAVDKLQSLGLLQ